MTNYDKLYDHQKTGVEYFKKYWKGFANFGDQGTGKSATVIVALEEIGAKRVLVVCPNSLKLNWVAEMAKWSTLEWFVQPIIGDKKKKLKLIDEAAKKPRFMVIINYESLITAEVFEALNACDFNMIVADESQKIKGHKTKSGKAIKAIKTSGRWILTGTPCPNNPLDIWGQLDFIRPGLLHKNFFVFRRRYAELYINDKITIVKKFINQDELREIIASVSYRVMKEECLDLPDKIFKTIEIEFKPKTAKLYRDMAKTMVVELLQDEDGAPLETVSASNVLTKALRLQQITSGFISGEDKVCHDVGTEKLDVLADVIKSLEGNHVIVWCRFRWECEAIVKRLSLKHKRVFALHGGVITSDRQAIVDDFQGEDPAILVCMVQVASVGLTLTAACLSVYYSRTFSLGDAMQSADRVHRIGQDKKCVYYDLVIKGTIDEHIVAMIKKKQGFADKLTGDDIKKMFLGES